MKDLLTAFPNAPGLLAAVVICGAFIWYLDRQSKSQSEERASERQLRKEMAEACHESHHRITSHMDSIRNDIRHTGTKMEGTLAAVREVMSETNVHLVDCRKIAERNAKLTERLLDGGN